MAMPHEDEIRSVERVRAQKRKGAAPKEPPHSLVNPNFRHKTSAREIAFGLGSLAAILAGALGEWAGVSFAIGALGVMVFAMIMSTALFLPSVRKMA